MHRKFVNTMLFASQPTNYIVVAIAIQSDANMDWRVLIMQHGGEAKQKVADIRAPRYSHVILCGVDS